MGGLTAALALAKEGFEDIQVFEAASDLGFVGAGIQLAPNMSRILDKLGVWQDIEKEAVILRETSIRGRNHKSREPYAGKLIEYRGFYRQGVRTCEFGIHRRDVPLSPYGRS